MEDKDKKKILVFELVLLVLVSLFLISNIIDNIYTDSPISEEGNQPFKVSISSNVSSGKVPLQISFYCFVEDNENAIVTYKWNFGDGSTSKLKNPKHVYMNKGEYNAYVTVINFEGLIETDNIKINVVENIPPVAKAYAYPEHGVIPLKVDYRGEGTDVDGKIVSYSWRFSGPSYKDSDYTTLRYPTRTYWRPGLYSAKLTVTDNDGAKDTDMIYVMVFNFRTAIKKLVLGFD